MIAAEPGVATRLMGKRHLAEWRLYVNKEDALWCARGPETTRGGYWWPFSASGCALYTLWVKHGDRALCAQLR